MVCATGAGSTRRSADNTESNQSTGSNDVGVTATDSRRRSCGRPACDDYRPSVVSADVTDQSCVNLLQHPSQTLQVPPSRRSTNSKPDCVSLKANDW